MPHFVSQTRRGSAGQNGFEFTTRCISTSENVLNLSYVRIPNLVTFDFFFFSFFCLACSTL